jgi:DNA-binding CsgD family transcriptional regulator
MDSTTLAIVATPFLGTAGVSDGADATAAGPRPNPSAYQYLAGPGRAVIGKVAGMLHGRSAEQSMIDGLIEEARRGVSGAAILRGEPGIGKTAMLDYAQGRAEGMRLLRGTGVESEAEVPFAGLHLLLRSSLGHLDGLPGPQRNALAGALGLGGASGDRFMIGAAVLSLLADLAESGPVLCLVDDTHWLDHASVEALLFAARRLDREGIVMLFAARDYPGVLRATGLTDIALRGLDEPSAAALLDEIGGVAVPSIRTRLIAETQGNPLALRELSATAAGPELGTGPIPLTSRVLDAFLHQVRLLPGATRTLLLVAAADDTGNLPTLLGAALGLGAGVSDLHPAEEARLVSTVDGTLTFRHPLIRAAVYHSATLAQRIAAHAALAAAFAGTGDVDRHAWHLAAGATGPDERVAAALERAAAGATARNAHSAAASGYERAGQLSPDRSAAIGRLVRACEAGVTSGQFDWARACAERGLDVATDPALRAQLTDVLARAEFAGGALHRAHGLFLTAAEKLADIDPERAFWMSMGALHAAWAAESDPRLISESADRLGALPLDPAAPLLSVAWLARWATAASLARDTSAYPPLESVIDRAGAAAARAGPRGSVEVSSFAFIAARDAVSADVAEKLVADARANGSVFVLPCALGQLSLAQAVLGRHREALINGTEAVRIARDTGQPLWERYAGSALAYLAAIEGNEQQCRENAEGAELDADAPAGSSTGTAWAQCALALLDLGNGRLPDAYDRLQAVRRGPLRHHSAVHRCVPDLVEAAVRLGRPADGAEAVTGYVRWARATSTPWVDALVARCRAMLAPEEDAERHFLDALAAHDPVDRPFDRGRTVLLYGEWLRRARRKRDASLQLSEALRLFEDIGAVPWAARARAELGAAGVGVPRAGNHAHRADLTPQELQICRLAAGGMSNRDIAARMFLSSRTVAYHLYKAYPKLGVRSRGELAGMSRW